ncbi:MAG: imidazole glycerol phosphate synthase subunit HisF [Planctomycetota bacterium]
MLTPRIIACLDIDAGRVVKGTQFQELRDCGDPAELAQRYAEDGADEIVLLDISATMQSRAHALAAVAAVRRVVDVPLCVGGGVRTLADGHALLAAGADKVAVNTAAVESPELLRAMADAFGSQAVVLAVDALPVAARPDAAEDAAASQVRTRAGSQHTGLLCVDWIRTATAGGAVGEVLLTSIDRDGTGEGYDTQLLAAVRAVTTVPLIASGGARTPAHLKSALAAGADAVLVASMLHDRRTTVPQLKAALQQLGVAIRPTVSIPTP